MLLLTIIILHLTHSHTPLHSALLKTYYVSNTIYSNTKVIIMTPL